MNRKTGKPVNPGRAAEARERAGILSSASAGTFQLRRQLHAPALGSRASPPVMRAARA
jgi:hypothetical protein